MLRIGPHVSYSKGFLNMGETAKSIGADTFQYFMRNPRGARAKAIDEKDLEDFKKFMEENNMGPILTHAPYTMNLASKTERTREIAHIILEDDLKKMELLPGNLYNLHPGSHVGQGVEEGTRLIVEALDSVLWDGMNTKVLLETMAGKGTEIGRSFEEIQNIISSSKYGDNIYVCLDTCHIFEAGYDIVNDLDGVLEEFDKVIGLEKLQAIHLNDSKNPLGARKDRHEKIGEGSLGIETFERIVNHPVLQNIPMYLETPNELDGYEHEIKILRELVK